MADRARPRNGPSILPAMRMPQEGRPRARSSFAAAFLSLLFPGLGHAYAAPCQRPIRSAAPDVSGLGSPAATFNAGTPNPSAGAIGPVPIPTYEPGSRLNILLIGADQRPKENTFNTDTMIVVSIDPATRQVAMFSLPRDT